MKLKTLHERFDDLCLRAARAGMQPWSYAVHSGRLEDRELARLWTAIYDHDHQMAMIGWAVQKVGRRWIVDRVG